MLFSRTAVHGIYTLCYLNQEPSGALLSAPAVAAALGIPKDQASKVRQSLNNAGLVSSIRGRRGGYALLKTLDKISIVEVLDALDPPQNDRRLRPNSCKREPTKLCDAHRGLQRLDDRLRQSLASETMEELIGTVCSERDGSIVKYRTELVCVTQGENSL